jgi:hypothetical protein
VTESSPAPIWGEVAVVDREIDRLRVSLSTTNGRDVRQAAQALYRRVLAPVKPPSATRSAW